MYSLIDCLTTAEERLQRMGKLAPGSYTGPHTISVCQLCGAVKWVTSGNLGNDIVVLTEMDGCDRCREVAVRNPEVFYWVEGVALNLARLILEERKRNV